MIEDKYVVFKREEWVSFVNSMPSQVMLHTPLPISDSVVLRMQDRFTASALQAYCDQISATVDILDDFGHPSLEMRRRLERLRDTFAEMAHKARQYPYRKVPD
jgi:hypothetical protein